MRSDRDGSRPTPLSIQRHPVRRRPGPGDAGLDCDRAQPLPGLVRRRGPRDLAMAWRLLAATGMRRGEALALRWRDVDLDAGRLAVRRSVGVVKTTGAGEHLVEGPTKTGQSRVVDLDSGTVAALRAYRAARGLVTLDLVRDSALVLSNLDGTHRHCRRAGTPESLQAIRR